MRIKHIALRTLLVLAMAGLTSNAMAGHSWSVYHWASMTYAFELTVINSTTDDWDVYVSQAVSDWSAFSVRRGNVETFIRIDPDGTVHITYVTWAIGY